jgi:preprotein translocase subunit SecF
MTTMNKLLTNTVKKVTVMSIVIAVLLIASFLVTFFVGANYGITTDDTATLTVTVDDYHFNNDASITKIETIAESTFKTAKVDPKATYRGEMSADSELVFVFENGTNLTVVKTALKTAFETEQAKADSVINAAEISVSTGSELLKSEIAWNFVWRAVAAAALFAGSARRSRPPLFRWSAPVPSAFSGSRRSSVRLERLPPFTSVFPSRGCSRDSSSLVMPFSFSAE